MFFACSATLFVILSFAAWYEAELACPSLKSVLAMKQWPFIWQCTWHCLSSILFICFLSLNSFARNYSKDSLWLHGHNLFYFLCCILTFFVHKSAFGDEEENRNIHERNRSCLHSLPICHRTAMALEHNNQCADVDTFSIFRQHTTQQFCNGGCENSSFTVYSQAREIHKAYIHTLAQILFQTINVKEPRNKIKNTQNHLLNNFQAQTHAHLTQMKPVTIKY